MNWPNFMERRTLIALCFRFNCKTLLSRHERKTFPGSDTAQACGYSG